MLRSHTVFYSVKPLSPCCSLCLCDIPYLKAQSLTEGSSRVRILEEILAAGQIKIVSCPAVSAVSVLKMCRAEHCSWSLLVSSPVGIVRF